VKTKNISCISVSNKTSREVCKERSQMIVTINCYFLIIIIVQSCVNMYKESLEKI